MSLGMERVHLLPLIFLMATAVVGSAADGPDDFQRDHWGGFNNGAWIISHKKTSFRENDIETTKKQVLVVNPAGGSVLTEHLMSDGQFGPPRSLGWHVPGRLPTSEQRISTREEGFALGTRKLPCTVSEYVVDGEKDPPTAKLVFWRCEAIRVPYRELGCAGPDVAMMPDVVRIQFEYSSNADPAKPISVWADVQVVQMDDEVTIGQKKIRCVVERGTLIEETARGKATARFQRWLSDEVPGRVVKETATGEFLDKKKSISGDFEMSWEVVDFGLGQKQ